MHAICGIHDDNRGVHDSNWCFTCHELTGGNVTAIETTTTKQTNPTQQANKNNKAKKKPRTASRSVPNPTDTPQWFPDKKVTKRNVEPPEAPNESSNQATKKIKIQPIIIQAPRIKINADTIEGCSSKDGSNSQ